MTFVSADALLGGGEAGPRRKQEEDLDVAGANAEARRLAIQLGFATVVSTISASPASQTQGTSSPNLEFAAAPQDPYSPPPMSPISMITMKSMRSDDSSTGPFVFDSHGQKAPYYEGPYYIKFEPSGKMIKKRWYGRLEDGYIAWSSVYLHDWFGYMVYTPLTQAEQEEMKATGTPPGWMYEFFSLPNVAIPLSYFCIGIALQLLRTPLIVYLIEDLNATAAEVNVLFTVMAVPWCFKVIYGFLSDCVPISGMRRKPYFMSGWVLYILSNFILVVTPQPSIGMVILLVFTQTAGYMLADVMTDALIVERSRYETEAKRGTMQSKGYIIRFFGSVIGASIGAVVYNKDDWSWYLPINVVFLINGAFPLLFLLPFVPYLLELETNCEPKNFFIQCYDLFATAQLRAVWQPMTFVYIYNALQLTNAAWMNFLVEGLDFSAWQIGLVGVVGSVMAWFGIMTYEKFFFGANWRMVYFWCTTLASCIALGQIILVFGINRLIGIPDIWFSMGDDVLVEFVIAVQFLPMCIMYLGLCPKGSEGTTYAMLTTWSNLAGSLAFDISTALTVIWDVSSETIANGGYEGIWKLTLLCGVVGPIPLLLLRLIPKDKEDQRILQADTQKHYWKGVIFISVMIFTLIVTFVESVYEVCFNDESERSEHSRRLMKLGH